VIQSCPPHTIIRSPDQTIECPDRGVGAPAPADIGVHELVVTLKRAPSPSGMPVSLNPPQTRSSVRSRRRSQPSVPTVRQSWESQPTNRRRIVPASRDQLARPAGPSPQQHLRTGPYRYAGGARVGRRSSDRVGSHVSLTDRSVRGVESRCRAESPQTIISLPVHTAQWSARASGTLNLPMWAATHPFEGRSALRRSTHRTYCSTSPDDHLAPGPDERMIPARAGAPAMEIGLQTSDADRTVRRSPARRCVVILTPDDQLRAGPDT